VGDNEHPFLNGWWTPDGGPCKFHESKSTVYRAFDKLESGDTINVGWEANSGGKTQTLFKYTVQ
jgi:DNA-binding PadR family transcriptional regulator